MLPWLAAYSSVAGWLGTAGKVGATVATVALATAVGGQTGALMTPANRRTMYAANRAATNLLPDIGDVIRLYNQSIGDEAWLRSMLAPHGIGGDTFATWKDMIDAHSAFPEIPLILAAYRRGTITQAQAMEWLGRHGLRMPEVRLLVLNQPYHWNAEQARILQSIDAITPAEYQKYIAASGLVLPADIAGFESMYQPPSTGEIFELRNRGDIDDDKMTEYMKLNGFTDRETRLLAEKLRFDNPPPSDLITFAVKDAFDANVVRTFGYDDEFPDVFRYWMAKSRYGGDPTDGGKIGRDSGLDSWAKAWWRAHWHPISPEQAYRMQQRLRPTGGADGGQRVPGVEPWLPSSTDLILKTQDYPPAFRARLAAIAYNVLRLVDIRRVVRLSLEDAEFKGRVIGSGFSVKAWAKEQFLDRGQTVTDADALAELSVAEALRSTTANAAKANAALIRVVEEQYRVGVVSNGDAFDAITRLKESNLSVQSATQMSLRLIDSQESLKVVKASIACVRQAYMAGRITSELALTRLASIGIVEGRAATLVALWQSCRHERRTMATTAAVIGWYKAGLLTEDQTYERLVNLGWDQADALLVVARAERGATRVRSQSSTPTSPTAMGQASDLQALRLEAVKSVKDIEAQIRRLTPVGLLNYMLQSGQIGEEYYTDRLSAMGLSEKDVNDELTVQRLVGKNGQA